MRQPYKTARCILYREPPHSSTSTSTSGYTDGIHANDYLLAVHSSFWGKSRKRWGLPGGQIEWGESPEIAVTRELQEELAIYVPKLIEIGPYPYKRSLHMVYAAVLDEPLGEWDDSELLDVRWFSEADVAALHTDDALHASYELDAIRALMQKLE